MPAVRKKYVKLNFFAIHIIDNHESISSLQKLEQTSGIGIQRVFFDSLIFLFSY